MEFRQIELERFLKLESYINKLDSRFSGEGLDTYIPQPLLAGEMKTFPVLKYTIDYLVSNRRDLCDNINKNLLRIYEAGGVFIMGFIDDLIIKLSGGRFSMAGLMKVSPGSMITERDKFITNRGVTKVVQVTKMPYIYTDELISVVTRGIQKNNPSVYVNTYIEADRITIPINNPTFISKHNKALAQYIEVDTMFNNLDPIHQKAGVFKHNGFRKQSFTLNDVIKAKEKSESFSEVMKNITENEGVYFKVKLFFYITYPDVATSNLLHLSIVRMINSKVKGVYDIKKKIATVLLNMSPAVTNIQKVGSEEILASEKSLTNLIPYRTQGLVSVKGDLLGTDINKNAPFYLDPYSTDEGSSVLIVGQSGSGKTVFAYQYGLQIMGNLNSVVYLDIKGRTVANALGQLMDNFSVINFSGDNAKFINTLILDKTNTFYTVEDAVKVTAELLMLMISLQPDEGNLRDMDIILKSTISGYYSSLDVYSTNPSSFYKTKDMTYGRVVELLGSNKNQASTEQERKLYDLAARRILYTLQEFNMVRNDNALDIVDLYSSDAVVFDFNKDQETKFTLIDSVRLFTSMFFTDQLIMYNKSFGKFTTLIGDEGNQYLNIPGLSSYISDVTARARSSNGSLVFITNDISVVNTPEMSGFKSNIAVFIIGRLLDGDVTQLDSITTSKRLINQVKQINSNPAKFKNCFAVQSSLSGQTVNSIVRVDLPKDVLKAFASRTVIK